MSEITGGEIRYKATMDIDGLKKGLEDGGKQLKGFTDIVKESGSDVDDFLNVTKENIRIQKNYIQELEGKYKDLQKTLDGMAPSKAKLSLMGEAAEIARDIELEKKALVDLQGAVTVTETKHVTLQTKLRAVKDEMIQLRDAGQKGSSQYSQLKDQAIAYQNELTAMNKELKALSGSTSITALVDSMGLLSGGLATANGLVVLLSGNNKNLDELMVRLQATMSAAIGIQQIQNALSKESSVIQNVMAVQSLARSRAEALATKNTIGATIAQRAFNLVAKANPYVLLATALVTVVGALLLFSGKTKKAVEDQEKLNKAIADGAAESIVKYKLLQTQWNSFNGDIKKQKKFIEENKDKFHELGVEVDNVKDAEKFLIEQSDAVVNAFKLRAEAAAYAQIATEKYKQAILEDAKVEQFDKDWKEAGVLGKIGLGVKATFTGIDDKAAQKLRDSAALDVTKQAEKLEEAQKSMDKAAKSFGGKTKTGKDKPTKTAKQTADEYLPPGSVAEIQKRLSEVDKALSKSNDDKQISALKEKRIAIAKELADAEKKIQIKSLQDQFSESQKLWANYYSAIENLDKPTADKIYGDLLKNDSSQFDALKKQQEALLSKANSTDKNGKSLITDEEKEVLSEVSTIINEMLGKQSQLDKFKDDISQALSTMATEAEKLQYIQDQKLIASKDTGAFAFLAEQERELQTKIQQDYQQFLNDHRSFEEQKVIITQQYAALREKILSDESLTPEQKYNAIAKAGQEQADVFSRAFMDNIANNPAYRQAFANLERMTLESLKKLRDNLVQALESLQNSGNATPEAIAQMRNEIENLNGFIYGKNPFEAIKDGIKAIGDESLSTEDKLKKIGAAGGAMQGLASVLSGSINDIKGIADDLGLSLDNAFGDALEKVQGVLEGIGQMGEGLATMAKGDPISIVTGGIKAIGGLIKAVGALFNNDRKKERNIKQWAKEVANLKEQYDQLQHSINKALGEDVYKNQIDQVKNLQQQQQKLQQMINEERSKKKADGGKIEEWQNQIKQLDMMIDDIRQNMIKSILQTDAKSLASGLAEALISAFEKGEDAAKSLDKVANDVFKNMIKNALQMRMEKALQPILDQMLSAAGFDKNGNGSFTGFSPEQIEYYKNLIAQVGLQQQGFLDAYGALFSEGPTASNLEGAIKGVTEETAGIIAGQMNAIRILQGESIKNQQSAFSILQQQLQQLILIEFNTRYIKNIYDAIEGNNGVLRAGGLI